MNPHPPIPGTLTVDALPVVAWLPRAAYGAAEAVAVAHRGQFPECADEPYVVIHARLKSDGVSWWAYDGVYDIATLDEAMSIAAEAR